VTGAPALVICCGFSGSGLPLGLQIVGRPFDEQGVLAIGHAYERANTWRAKRPVLVPGRTQPPLTPVAPSVDANDIPRDVRDTAREFAARAGLELNDFQFAQLARATPHALAMAVRIRRRRSRSDEPASVFRLS
jgi:aspartyl-tRNA(Asn)/glutamyl-tRNA(Gln) amidotransferase subunit A